MKTSNSISPELETKFKNSDPDIQAFVDALQLELVKLHKINIKLEANNVSLDARINALEDELKELQPFGEMSKEARAEMMKDLEETLKEEERIRNLPKEEIERFSDDLKKKSENLKKKIVE